MKPRIFPILFFIFLAALHARAQRGEITGRVCDEEARPLAGAAVRLLADTVNVAGTATDADGRFAFDNLDGGNYRLLVSMVGRESRELSVRGVERRTDVGDVRLAATTQLGEAVVQGKRSAYERDVLTVYPSADDRKYAADGYTLTSRLNLPNIEVDVFSGETKRYGEAVSFYIDNRPATDREVKMLNPRNVARVELHENPRGEFAGKKTVVNFILRERRSGGRVGIDVTQDRGRSGQYMAYVQLAAGRSEWSLAVDPGSFTNQEVRNDRSDWFNAGDGAGWFGRLREGRWSPTRSLQPGATLTYNLKKGHHQLHLGAGLSYQRSTAADRYTETDLRTGAAADVAATTRRRGTSPTAGAFYRFGDGRGNVFTVEARYAHTHNNRRQQNRTLHADGTPFALDSRARENYHSAQFILRYDRQLGPWQLGAMSWNGMDRSDIDFVGYSAPRSVSEQWLTQNLVFASVTVKQWWFAAQYGVMYSYDRQTDMGHRGKVHHRPVLQAQYSFGSKGYNLLSFSKYSGGLPLSSLSAVEQQLNELEWQRGNPALRYAEMFDVDDQLSHALGGGYVTARARYSRTRHNVTYTTLAESAGGATRFVHMPDDATTWHMISASVGYSKRFFGCLNAGVNGQWTRSIVTGPGGGHGSSFTGSARLTFMKKGWTAGIQARSAHTIRTSEADVKHNPAWMQLMAGYAYGGLNIMAAWECPWRMRTWNYADRGAAYRSRSWTETNHARNRFFVRLTWNVTFGKKHNFGQAGVDKTHRTGIVGD